MAQSCSSAQREPRPQSRCYHIGRASTSAQSSERWGGSCLDELQQVLAQLLVVCTGEHHHRVRAHLQHALKIRRGRITILIKSVAGNGAAKPRSSCWTSHIIVSQTDTPPVWEPHGRV